MPKRNIPYFTVPCHDCGTPVQREHKPRPGKQARCPECYAIHMKAWQREYGERYRTARAAGYEPTQVRKPLQPITLACEVCGAPIIRHRQPSKGRAMRCDPCRNKRPPWTGTVTLACRDCGAPVQRRRRVVVRCPPCIEKKLKANWEAQRGHPLMPYSCARCGEPVYRTRPPSKTDEYRCPPCDRKVRAARQLERSRASKPPKTRIRFCMGCGACIPMADMGKIPKRCEKCRPEVQKLHKLDMNVYKVRPLLLEVQRYKCANPFCRRKLRDDAATEVDHIVPVAKGGGGELSNLQALCTPCNRAKRDKHYGEWLEAQRLQRERESA